MEINFYFNYVNNLQVKRMVISTYQAASGAGAAAMEELELQTREVFIFTTSLSDLKGKSFFLSFSPFNLYTCFFGTRC